MPDESPDELAPISLIAVSVGNSRTAIARFTGQEPTGTATLPSDQTDEIARRIERLATSDGDGPAAPIVLASVNRPRAEAIIASLGGASSREIFVLGEDLPIPIEVRLDAEAITGHDRLLAALAAKEMLNQACVVVDAGTAITVDFVDGEGVFHGGAIAPGARTSLRALHEHTHALPELSLEAPSPEPFGRNTAQAMLLGVTQAARGLVRILTERYAEAYDAYPPVIATGGDAEFLFADEPLVDRIIPDLALRGIAIACRNALTAEDEARDGPSG